MASGGAVEEEAVAGVAVAGAAVLNFGNSWVNRKGFFTQAAIESESAIYVRDLIDLDTSRKRFDKLQLTAGKQRELNSLRKTIDRCRQTTSQYEQRLADLVAQAHDGNLHSQVQPQRWAVSREDLVAFGKAAEQRWKANAIPKSETFPLPGHDDPKIGPSMYQVNEHLIKWVTRQAGGMSWALMCNPNGLSCDLFVSHAWCEGVFEFVRHMLKAWPWRANNLWCCFLANPQCGGIENLLEGPLEKSPFHQALEHCSDFIVIPNQSGSVYSRLWCVYEIHLAIQWNKLITMPTLKPELVFWSFFATYRLCFLCLFVGTCFTMAVHFLAYKLLPDRDIHNHLVGGSLLSWPLVATVAVWRQYLDCEKRWVVYFLFFLTGVLGGGIRHLFFFVCDIAPVGIHQSMRSLLEEAFILPGCLFIFAATGIYDELYHEMEHNAQKHGSVRDAVCSHSADSRKIRRAIAGREANIDATIETLIRAGNYNETIKNLARSGYPLQSLRYNPTAYVLPVHVGLLMVAEAHKSYHFIMQGFLVLGGMLVGARWNAYVVSSPIWEKCLWMRRLDKTAWLLAGSHYVFYFLKITKPWLRLPLVLPIWFLLPVAGKVWYGPDLNLTCMSCVIALLALAHLANICNAMSDDAYASWVAPCTIAAAVAISYAIILKDVVRAEWRRCSAVARRLIIISMVSLVLGDILLRMPLMKLVMSKFLRLTGEAHPDSIVARKMQIMCAFMSFLAPMLNLLALRDSLWQWQDRSLATCSMAGSLSASDLEGAGRDEGDIPFVPLLQQLD